MERSYWRESLCEGAFYKLSMVTTEEELNVESMEISDKWLAYAGENRDYDVWMQEAAASEEEGLRYDELSLYYCNEKNQITAAVLAEDGGADVIRIRSIFTEDTRALAVILRIFTDLLDEFLMGERKILVSCSQEQLLDEIFEGAFTTDEELPDYLERGHVLESDPGIIGFFGESFVKLNTMEVYLSEKNYITTLIAEEMIQPVLAVSCEGEQALMIRYSDEEYILSSLVPADEEGNYLYDRISAPEGTPIEQVAEETIIPAVEMLNSREK